MPRVQMVAAALAVIALVGVGAVVLLDQLKPEPPPRQVAGYTPTFQPPPANSPPLANDAAPVQQVGTGSSSPADQKPLIEAASESGAGRQARPAPPPKVVHFQKQDLTWPEVEERFDKLREARQSDHSKVHDLQALYASVADPAFVAAEDYPTLCAELGAWRDAMPESPTPLVALADAHIRWAWEARGSGPARTVSEEGWKLFHTRLDEARRMSERAIELGARDGQPYRCLITVGMAESATKEELREVLDAGRKVDPLYVAMYEQMAIALMPRWGGDPGDVERFANEVATLVPGDDGLELFGLIAYQIHCYERNDPVTILWGQYDRKLLAPAADVLAKRYPNSQRTVQFAAYLSMIAQDHEVAGRIRPLVQGFAREHLAFVDQNAHRQFIKWAEAPNISGQESATFWSALAGCVGLAFDSDSRHIWVGQQFGARSAILIDSQTGTLEGALPHPRGIVNAAEFSPEQRVVAISTWRGPLVGVCLFDLDDPLGQIIVPTENKPDGLTLNPKHRQVLWVEHSSDAPPRWRLFDFSMESQEPKDLQIADATTVEFLPNGKHLAVNHVGGCRIIDAATGKESIQLPKSDQWQVLGVAPYSICDVDEEGRIWVIGQSVADRKNILARYSPDVQSVEILVDNFVSRHPLALSPDRRYLAVGVDQGPGDNGQTIQIFRTEDNQPLGAFPGHISHIGKLVFSPDGRKLASVALMSDVVKVWSLDDLEQGKAGGSTAVVP